MRSLDDVKAWLSQASTGTCETSAAPFWRLLQRFSPEGRIVTVRRPVEEVLASLCKLAHYPDLGDLRRLLLRLDAKLDQVEGRVKGVLSIPFSSLEEESSCAEVFQHCLPYPHDHSWWKTCAERNVQVNFSALVRYAQANQSALARLVGQGKEAMLKDLALRPASREGLEITLEPFPSFLSSCEWLFRQHCAQVGEDPENWKKKNLPLMQKLCDMGVMQILVGRVEGRAYGYLMTLVSPSLEERGKMSAQHATFFSSPKFPGLGLRLQRASLQSLAAQGVSETFMQAGIRGDGERMGTLYKRLGAQDFGRMFRIDLAA